MMASRSLRNRRPSSVRPNSAVWARRIATSARDGSYPNGVGSGDDPTVIMVIDDAALLRAIGPDQVMTAQDADDQLIP